MSEIGQPVREFEVIEEPALPPQEPLQLPEETPTENPVEAPVEVPAEEVPAYVGQ
jgi:hypothetical protein